ncbi:hypothetical protein ACIBCR_15325 [Micromonospora echinospora]|uniref:hypothetical protein n=1 Tax=Micromonospora echinospora TaxID=1877 RepID=UPI00379B96D0
MIAAVLTATGRGHHLRLSNYGQAITSMPVAVECGEEPTDAAERALAEHGWTITEQWTPSSLDGWIAYVDYQPDQVPA